MLDIPVVFLTTQVDEGTRPSHSDQCGQLSAEASAFTTNRRGPSKRTAPIWLSLRPSGPPENLAQTRCTIRFSLKLNPLLHATSST
jgi:hypothetical protein